MNSAVLLVCLSGAALVGCAYLPTAGPTAGDVIERGVQENQIRYDVVDVDSGVVATLLAQPAESFRTRFGKYGMPAAPKSGSAIRFPFRSGKPRAEACSGHRRPTTCRPVREA